MKDVHVYLEEKDYLRFRAYLIERKETVSSWLRDIIKKVVEENDQNKMKTIKNLLKKDKGGDK